MDGNAWKGLKNLVIIIIAAVLVVILLLAFKLNNEMNLKDQYYNELQQYKNDLSSANESLKEKDTKIRNLNNVIDNRPNYNQLLEEMVLQTHLIYELKQANLQSIKDNESMDQLIMLKLDKALINHANDIE